MKQDSPLTDTRKRAIDRWLEHNYGQLTKHTGHKLRQYGFQSRDSGELISRLYDVLLRKAYAHEGWLTDRDILLKSKSWLTGWVKDLPAHYRKHDSIDAIQEAHEDHGRELPQAFAVEATDFEKRSQLQRVAQARDAVCQSPYDYALIEVLMGERTCEAVAKDYQCHHSTISRHSRKLGQDLREYMLMKGWV